MPSSPSTNWRKSNYSSAQTNCVEVGRSGDLAAVRDSKDRSAGHLAVHPDRWSSFLTALKSDRYPTP
ncbi:DUF397 domain-containing protein [Saccharopolyspora sp. NPDC047091]|uniref:DUF397 domain-containing protein n=1 Tax=Saccharopolyspora sp. NPDC047091 TaxID=3155924 RepID=UPI0033E61F8E